MQSFLSTLRLSALILLGGCFAFTTNAQTAKKVIDHSDYDQWQRLSATQISPDGNILTYEVRPQKGDGFLYIQDLSNNKETAISRGQQAKISPTAGYVVSRLKPHADSVRKAKLAKKKGDDLPKDSLLIWTRAEDKRTIIPDIKSFQLPKDGGEWFAYLIEPVKTPKDTTKSEDGEKKKPEKKKGKKGKKDKKKGDLVIMNPITGESFSFSHVNNYSISDNGATIGFITAFGDSIDSTAVTLFHTSSKETQTIYKAEGIAKRIGLDHGGEQAAFLVSQDTGKVKLFSAYYQKGEEDAREVISQTFEGLNEGWTVSDNSKLQFSANGKRLFLGTAPAPQPEPKDTLTDDEKARVDVWNWKDARLQPQQLVELKRDQKATYLAVWNIQENQFFQIGDEMITAVDSLMKGNADIAWGNSNIPYLKERSWESPFARDSYILNLKTGIKAKVLTRQQFLGRVSPAGKYVYWYNGVERVWYAKAVGSNNAIALTKNLKVNFYDEEHDSPAIARSYGVDGWTEGDEFLLIRDRFDIWKIDPTGAKKPKNLTKKFGRKENIRLRYVKIDRDNPYVDTDHFLLKGTHDKTQREAFYLADYSGKKTPQEIYGADARLSSPVKAKEADRMIWTRQSLQESPNVWVSNLDFTDAKKLSNTNPQQSEYNWATVEIVSWTSFDGNKLDGLLYKPENFDPNKKYPLMVYFYEKITPRIHGYTAPAPSRSTINATVYASNGYVVFMPNIVYKTGQPGEDGYNAVVSGTEHLVKTYSFINKDKMAIQGQSWGGYQVAYIVTKTDMYTAAMAGAPVSNMTSAYGGIRWGSGYSRMFQYEKTQSRLGATLWEKPDVYIKNSPLFSAPNIKTPLLMMHNDKDSAVPWYQGIEFFVGLRRLNKPVWMLVYNDEVHNLRRRANQMDLAIRMKQFFDHYLQDAPVPVWMEEGVPAIKKGKMTGYELMEGETADDK